MADGDTVLVVTVLDLDLDRRLLLVVEAEPIGDVLKLPWSAEGDHLLFSARTARAMRYAAERRNLDESIEELRQIAADARDRNSRVDAPRHLWRFCIRRMPMPRRRQRGPWR
jgi:hypothetical protein